MNDLNNTNLLEEWPESELERVLNCPVCCGISRRVIQEDLIDNVFLTAPGKWILQQCMQCQSAYLDPRPTEVSIGKAYGNYYTHAVNSNQIPEEQLGIFLRIRRRISNGYLNHRYGTHRLPSSLMGKWVAKVFARQRQILDADFRYLPKPNHGQRLLDIGCGNGFFLLRAREAGWLVQGVDLDPEAVTVARQHGLNVSEGTVRLLDGEASCFDSITLSHVIEHVYDPRHLLKAIHRLLKPGGVVYIDTPNINSFGANFFGRNWRGLEAPRHLVLFNTASLVGLLRETGLNAIDIKRRTAVLQDMDRSSQRIAQGLSPYNCEPTPFYKKVRASYSYTKTRQLEFITLLAYKRK